MIADRSQQRLVILTHRIRALIGVEQIERFPRMQSTSPARNGDQSAKLRQRSLTRAGQVNAKQDIALRLQLSFLFARRLL
jgi:hypothetical protein